MSPVFIWSWVNSRLDCLFIHSRTSTGVSFKSECCYKAGYGCADERLDGLGIEYLLDNIFHTCPHSSWGLLSFVCNGSRLIPLGYSGRYVALTTKPRLTPSLKKQWICTSTPPSGPSKPVLEWTLPLTCRLLISKYIFLRGNKMPTRCKRWFLIAKMYCLLNMFRGTIMPIIRSSRLLDRWLLPVALGDLVFKLLVWCGAVGYVSGLRDADLLSRLVSKLPK